MSNKNNDNLIAGIVTVGVGVLAGLGYVAYQLFSNENKETPSSSSTEPVVNESASRVKPKIFKECGVCSRIIKENEEFTLTCQHAFHKQCISAQYILQSDSPSIRCPVETCKRSLSVAEIGLISHM